MSNSSKTVISRIVSTKFLDFKNDTNEPFYHEQ